MRNFNNSLLTFIVANTCIAILGAVGLLFYLSIPFMFDAPGSEHSIHAWLILLSVIAMPITCFGSIAISIIQAINQRIYSQSMNCLRVPLINTLIIIILFIK